MYQSLAGTARIRRHPEHLATEVDGQTVLMNVDVGKYAGLDAIGQAIWSRIAQPVTLDELCRALLTVFDADAAVLRRDVEAFLVAMQALGLIEIV